MMQENVHELIDEYISDVVQIGGSFQTKCITDSRFWDIIETKCPLSPWAANMGNCSRSMRIRRPKRIRSFNSCSA